MKKIIGVTLLSLLPVSASANEISGTRVTGQVAIDCPAGTGRALEINATTHQEFTYCVELSRPSEKEIRQRQREQVAQAITQQKNSNAPVVAVSEIVTAQPISISVERPTKTEINVSTGLTTVSQFDDEELNQWLLDTARNQARENARSTARERAEQDAGTEYCVKWETLAEQGEECHLTPILATNDEVNNWLAILSILMNRWNFFEWLRI